MLPSRHGLGDPGTTEPSSQPPLPPLICVALHLLSAHCRKGNTSSFQYVHRYIWKDTFCEHVSNGAEKQRNQSIIPRKERLFSLKVSLITRQLTVTHPQLPIGGKKKKANNPATPVSFAFVFDSLRIKRLSSVQYS